MSKTKLNRIIEEYIPPSTRHLPEAERSVENSKQQIKDLILDIRKGSTNGYTREFSIKVFDKNIQEL